MKEKRFDAAALGELLMDFTENGVSEQGNTLFEANPGGAPCNVLAMLARLGRKTAFLGKVGADAFGRRLRRAGEDAGICMEGLIEDKTVPTTLAFVHKLENGDRDFSFYRGPGADRMLTVQELSRPLLEDCKIFHFGTLSLTHEPVRSATQAALLLAKEAGALISFDPNLRPPLWDDLETAREQIAWGLAQCDVLKIADNELEFMTGETDFRKGAGRLLAQYPGIRLMNVTAGPGGSYAAYQGLWVHRPGLALGGVVDTTGAGDTFCACVLNFLLDRGLDALDAKDLEQMLSFANAAAYLVTTKKGAIRSMPDRAQVEELLRASAGNR